MISPKLVPVVASLCFLTPALVLGQTIPNTANYSAGPPAVPAPTYGSVIINPVGSGGSPCAVGTVGCTGLPIGSGNLTGAFNSNPDVNTSLGVSTSPVTTTLPPPYYLQLNYGQATTLLQTSGGATGFVLTIEASFDNGSTWVPVYGYPLGGGPATTTIGYSASTQRFLVNTAGYTNLGLFVTTAVTGTVTVSSNQSSTPSFVNVASASIGSGAVASGAFTSGSIMAGAEVDIGSGPTPAANTVNARLITLNSTLGTPMQNSGGAVQLVAGSATIGGTVPTASTTGGTIGLCSLSLKTQSSGTTSCASGAHQAYVYVFDNSQNNTEEFVQSYNAASGGTIGSSVRSCWGVAAGGEMVIPDPVGDAYSTAMSFSVAASCSGSTIPTNAVGITVLGS